MVRGSVPFSSMWTAKAWRKLCGVMGLEMPERLCASWHAFSTAWRVIGLSADLPGNNQIRGRSVRHHWRSVSSSRTDSMTYRSLCPFALLDANHHALRVDIPRFQMDGFGNAQAGGVTGRQDRAVFNMGDALQKLENFFGAENNGQFARHFRHGNDLLQCPMIVQCFVVDETERRHRNADRTGRQFLFRCQIHLVGPNLLRTERFW